MTAYSITLRMRPKAKARPRVTRHGTYTPKSTLEYERAVGMAYKAAGGKMLEGAVILDITACFRIPQNKKIEDGAAYTKTPDADNIAKAILDGLNHVAYEDDRQVAELGVRKVYGEHDCVQVIVAQI